MSLFLAGRRSGMFVRSPLEEVKQCLINWGKEQVVNRNYIVKYGNGDFVDAIDNTNTKTFPPTRAVLLSTTTGWTGFFDNHPSEFLPQAEFFIFSTRLKTQVVFFSIDEYVDSRNFGSLHFKEYSYNQGVERSREVLIYKEDEWVLSSSGNPSAIESSHPFAVGADNYSVLVGIATAESIELKNSLFFDRRYCVACW